ncbi:hypothetical protein LTR66_017777 [Elasticomyces elasticus]|nr:hypothetical protein LTR66_017777 [Elasticomyces elasticus]
MPSTYTGHTPPATATLDPRIVPFFERFYATSDTKGEASDREYADAVTEGGTLIMGSKTAEGYEQILALRQGLWSGPVAKRKHHVSQIYPFTSMDCMLHGTVDYVLKNGKELSVDWAAKAVFVEEVEGDGSDGQVRMRFYQVYVDSGRVMAAASS